MARRSNLSQRLILWIAVMLALPLLAGLLFIVVINPNDYKPDVVAALQNATGRRVTINGNLAVGFGLSPTILITNIHLANPPGFSRDDMATIGTLSVKVSLPSLVFGKLHIKKLNLTDANVQIETNPLGQTNTKFSAANPPQPADSAPQSPERTSNQAAEPVANPLDKIQIDEIGVFSGRFTRRDDVAGQRHELLINRAVLHAVGDEQRLNTQGDIVYDHVPLTFKMETGALGRLFGQNIGPVDWPLRVHAQSGASELTVHGTLADPLGGHGYQMSVEGAVNDLSEIGPLLGITLPAVHDLRASFQVRDNDGVPEFSSLLIRSGASDLSTYADGLTVDHLVLSAPEMNQPMHGELVGQFGTQPVLATLDLGAPQGLIIAALRGGTKPSNASQVLPIKIDAQIAGGHLAVQGQIDHPTTLSGLNATIDVQVPDLTKFSALAGQRLPALTNLSFNVRVTDRDGGLTQGVALHNLAFNGSLGDVAGDLEIGLKPHLLLKGALSGKRLDMDALQVANERAIASAPSAGAEAKATEMRAVAPSRFVIPDEPIDFAPLSAFDADLRLAMGEIHSGGVLYRDLVGHVVLDHGKLVVDQFAATLPGGKLKLSLSVDSLALPPAMSVVMSAPGMALKPLLMAFHQPDDVIGTVEVGADLSAAGRTPHAIAASLSGKFGLAMVDGELDNRILGTSLNQVLRAARLPVDALVGGSGGNRTKLRCVAVRIDSVRGLASVNNLVLQTSTAQLQGAGTVNLTDESLSLRLRPALRSSGVPVVVPVRVTGSLTAPIASLDASGAAQGVLSGVAGLAGGLANLARNPAAALAASDSDPCGPGLAAARAAQPATN